MHVEGVAARGAGRPARPGQRVTRHHGPVAVEQGRHQAGLHRRERHPGAAEAEHAVLVEVGHGRRLASAAAARRPGPAGPPPTAGTRIQSSRSSSGTGGGTPSSSSSNRGRPASSSSPRRSLLRGPTHEDDIHPSEGKEALFRDCFGPVKRSGASGREDPAHAWSWIPMLRAMARSPIDHLASVSLFSACSKKELQAVARASDQVDLAEGRALCEQGSIGREAFIILEGTAEVKRNGKQGRDAQGGRHLRGAGAPRPRAAHGHRHGHDAAEGARDRRPRVRRRHRRGPADRAQAPEGARRPRPGARHQALRLTW